MGRRVGRARAVEGEGEGEDARTRGGVRRGEERREGGRDLEGSIRSKAVMSCAMGDAVPTFLCWAGLVGVDLTELDLADDDWMGGRGERGAA